MLSMPSPGEGELLVIRRAWAGQSRGPDPLMKEESVLRGREAPPAVLRGSGF